MRPVNKRKKRGAAKNRKKKEDAPKRFTQFAKGVAKMMTAGLLMAILFFGGRLGLAHAMELSYFNVARVTVVGKSVVDEKNIMDMIGPVLGKNIFECDLKEMGGRIKGHPWIREVEIRRELPDDLMVRLKERKPAAYVQLARDGLWLMDDQGVLLSKIAKDESMGMIIFTGLRLGKAKVKPGYGIGMKKIYSALNTANMLMGYKLFGKHRMYRIDLSNPAKLGVFFEGSGIVLITPRHKWSDEVERLKVVDYILRKKTGNIKSIDLTFMDKVIVTYPEA